MIRVPRASVHSTSVDHSRVAIILREGSDFDQILLSLIFLIEVIWLGNRGQNLVTLDQQLIMLPMMGLGLSGYIAITLLVRKYFYPLVIINQGLTHPKFLLSFFTLTLTLLQNEGLTIVLITFAIMCTLDAILQNQLHDYAIVISKFGVHIEYTLPVLHIPFQTRKELELSEGKIMIQMKNKSTGSQYISPHEIAEELDEWIEVNIPIGASHSLRIYRSNRGQEIHDLLTQIRSIVELELKV